MGPFVSFNVAENNVEIVSNSTTADFQYNGTALKFNVRGENGTFGFCRMRIPKSLVDGTYKVFVNGVQVAHTLLTCSNSTHGYLYCTYEFSAEDTLVGQADLNKDGIVDMRDASILSKALLSRPGDSDWNPAADLNSDGVIDNLDMDLLASVFYQSTDMAEYQVTVIPEFPSIFVLSLFMMATLLAIIFYRRKHATKRETRA
jgi:hypothetical protein